MTLSAPQEKDLDAILVYYGSVLGDDKAEQYISQIVGSTFLCAQKEELDARGAFSCLMDSLWELYIEHVYSADDRKSAAMTVLTAIQDDLNAELIDNYKRKFSTFLRQSF